MRKKIIPDERLIDLMNHLDLFSKKSPKRIQLIKDFSELYGVTKHTVYRRFKERNHPKPLKRKDNGIPRNISLEEMGSIKHLG